MNTSRLNRAFAALVTVTLATVFPGQMAIAQTLNNQTASAENEQSIPVENHKQIAAKSLSSDLSGTTLASTRNSVRSAVTLMAVERQPQAVAPVQEPLSLALVRSNPHSTTASALLPAPQMGSVLAQVEQSSSLLLQTAPSPATSVESTPVAPTSSTTTLNSDFLTQASPSPADPSTPGSTPSTPVDPAAPQPDTTTPEPQFQQQAPAEPAPQPLPGTQDVRPGRATRSGPSYVGIGGNIGLGEGDTALGEGSFAVFSKIGLTRNLSVRPTVLFSDDPTILIPVTFDFTPGATDVTEDVSRDLGRRISPFIGPGIAISTGDDAAVDFLVSAGVDVPITRRLTATASLNASFFDNIAIGLILGIGINF